MVHNVDGRNARRFDDPGRLAGQYLKAVLDESSPRKPVGNPFRSRQMSSSFARPFARHDHHDVYSTNEIMLFLVVGIWRRLASGRAIVGDESHHSGRWSR